MKKENECKFIISGRGAGRNVSKVKQCNKCFASIHCVDGSCPSAQYESICSNYGYELASDMGLKMIKCSKCPYNTQQCSDCIFENTKDCYKNRKEKNEKTGKFLDKNLPRDSFRYESTDIN